MTFRLTAVPNRFRVEQDGDFLGSVQKEVFNSYLRNGKIVERSFWTASTKGYTKLPGRFTSRQKAANALVPTQEKTLTKIRRSSYERRRV